MELKDHVPELNKRFSNAQPEALLRYFLHEFSGKIALASSFGAEDQVLTDMVVKIDTNAAIFTLDTGRLFYETYDLNERTSSKYNVNIQIFFPNASDVEKMVNEKGINLFYQSVENRKECCGIRKIEPLKRAFAGLNMWICGLRRDQSVTRTDMQRVEWDEANGLVKINPLIDWSEQQVWDYIKEHKVPYNPLHDKGFASIGCQPCTRAIEPSEDIRAGRWWWENPENKECGLHKR